MNARLLSFIVTGALALASTACSGSVAEEPDPASAAESEESALATDDLAAVAAVGVDVASGHSVVGAPNKVKALMKAFRRSTGPTPRCGMARATRFTFYNLSGESIGTGSVLCFRGTIHLKSGREIAFVTRPGDLAVLQEPTVVADGLWGVTKIHARAHAKNVDFTKKADIGTLLEAVGLEQEFGPLGPRMRCMSSHSLEFYRGTNRIGIANYNCGGDAPETLSVNFEMQDPANATAPLANGSITIQAKDIEEMIDAASE